MDKRGISAIVTAVLIILITIAGVAIIWTTVVPMVRDDMDFSSLSGRVTIVTSGGHTTYDSSAGLASVQIERGFDNGVMNRTLVTFYFNGNSVDSKVVAPAPGNSKTYVFNLGSYGRPNKVSVAPIFAVGNREKLGDITSEVEFREGSVSGSVIYQLGGDYFGGTTFETGSIVVGRNHTCGIRASDSRVLCWGSDLYGQLGDGSAGSGISTPTLISDVSAYTSLAAGEYHTCGIRSSDGQVLCWGGDLYGQLGDGSVDSGDATPSLIVGGNSFTSISSGLLHTCGIRASDNMVLCWGYNSNGELGNGSIGSGNPVPRPTVDGVAYMSVSCGGYSTCGTRLNDNRVLCWGEGASGQLGNGAVGSGNPVPTLTTDSNAYAVLSVGLHHACGIKLMDGRVLCWGGNTDGQLGGGSMGIDSLVPALISDGNAYKSLAAGYNFTCGVRDSDNQVLCWGRGDAGQLGNGATASSSSPIPISDSDSYVALTSGESHVCGIRSSDGRVLCWGSDGQGKLGNGVGTTDSLIPAPTVDVEAYAY